MGVLQVERWGLAEIRIPGGDGDGSSVTLGRVRFTDADGSVEVDGFRDGDGALVARFSPDRLGRWSYRWSGVEVDDDVRDGVIECVPPSEGNHGPVLVDGVGFRHADGTGYRPVGTTCYVWTHQPAAVQDRTLSSLAASPFTKIRMCVFPKNYAHNLTEPTRHPFPRRDDGFDLDRFDATYFAGLERRILALQELGIECDLILFHPYDKGRWGFDRMSAEDDERYLRHVVARLGAFRHVWWSMANEYDFMTAKTIADWDRLFATLAACDPYRRLASIHNGTRMYDQDSLHLYDHHHPAISHVSLQHWDLHQMRWWLAEWGKPVSVDECGYEGNLHQRWGNLTAEEMVDRTWVGTLLGGHVGHGETYYDDEDDVLWWSHGGVLHGDAPERIAFLHRLLDGLGDDTAPLPQYYDAPTIGVADEVILQYYGTHRPARRQFELPADREFNVDIVDTWQMTVRRCPGTISGAAIVELPGTAYQAVLLRAVR